MTVSAAPMFLATLAIGMVTFTPTAPVYADKSDALAVLAGLRDKDPLARGIESDAADRTRLADRMRMLSQRVAASACALTSGVAEEESRFWLEESMHEADIIVEALREGNEALHVLGPETDRRILHDLEAFEDAWARVHTAVEAVLEDPANIEASHFIDDQNLTLLDLATALSGDISTRYLNPYEMTQADAMLIEISGRQMMLTQKMSKDACEIWSGYHAEEGRADLEQTMKIFDASLNALRHGMPAAGVMPAPTPQIEKDLDGLLSRWSDIRGNLDTLVAGGALQDAGKTAVFRDFNVELDELDVLVHDYKAYAERNH